jgi:predicted DNA-binding transcriptional regulator AlpA
VTGRLLTTREVAERYGVSPETILRWKDRLGLPVIVLTSRALRYDTDALDTWEAERTRAASPGREGVSNPDRRRRQSEANLSGSAIPLPQAARTEED